MIDSSKARDTESVDLTISQGNMAVDTLGSGERSIVEVREGRQETSNTAEERGQAACIRNVMNEEGQV